MKKIITLTVAFVTMTLCCLAQEQYVYSVKGNVNLRAAASTSAAKVGTLKKGEMFPLLEEAEGWYKIAVNGKPVYVSQSVSTTCDAVIPSEMFDKSLTSNKGADKIRFQGDFEISSIDKTHALINITWMRVNLPAESYCYIADVKDGKIVATYWRFGYGDASEGLDALIGDASKLDTPMPVGFNEWNNTIVFDGVLYSEFE